MSWHDALALERQPTAHPQAEPELNTQLGCLCPVTRDAKLG